MAKADQELRFGNVSLHSRGKVEHGTLRFTRHHFYFTFHPADGQQLAGAKLSSNHPSVPSAESSRLAEASVASNATTSSDETADTSSQPKPNGPLDSAHLENGVRAGEKGKEERRKQRPKEIWVPYPLVSSCILRPSHTLGQVAPPRIDDEAPKAVHDDDDLFPPTFGTASYDNRASTDSNRLAAYASPPRPSSPAAHNTDGARTKESARQPAIRIRLKDFRMMALHFHLPQADTSPDDAARQAFHLFRSRCCIDRIEDLHAFHFHPAREEGSATGMEYDARREFARMGISGKAADGPGTAWRISDINVDYSYSATYPNVLCVPRAVSDNMLKYGGVFRSRSRIPTLTYLHPNGGSITRSSQPMVGVQNKRSPQDEKLVSAIFASHTPPLEAPDTTSPDSTSLAGQSTNATVEEHQGLPTSQSETALDEKPDEKQTPARKKVYGSTRRNLIIDARPRINALANRATGGGIEDVANYTGSSTTPVEKVFLNIPNIHVMRASLERVIESLANSDYLDMKPDQELLRKSGWLTHIASVLEGAEMVARVVGLGGSHALVHCSDGWDRTAQVSALAQVMLDPHYRTLDGFIALVQKDFVSFGFKFRDRDGIEGSEKWFEIENERIAPSRIRENNASDPTSLNALGAKAFSGAKNWFEKNRSNIFRQQNQSRDNVTEQVPSRPTTPPPNSLLHSPPTSTGKEDRDHKMSEKEVSPVFHQFLDAMFQLRHQSPNAFEFSERFLRRLFYHAYSCQYGEFLFNCERERGQGMGKARSVWPHFLCRRHEFINPDYVAKIDDPLVFPKRQGPEREIEVRWWHDLFGRKDEEMNLPRALAPADPPVVPTITTAESSVSFDERSTHEVEYSDTVPQDMAAKMEELTMRTDSGASSAPSSIHQDADFEVVKNQPDAPHAEEVVPESAARSEPVAVEYDGDPLGVTSKVSERPARSELDFAAFASQTVFRDR